MRKVKIHQEDLEAITGVMLEAQNLTKNGISHERLAVLIGCIMAMPNMDRKAVFEVFADANVIRKAVKRAPGIAIAANETESPA